MAFPAVSTTSVVGRKSLATQLGLSSGEIERDLGIDSRIRGVYVSSTSLKTILEKSCVPCIPFFGVKLVKFMDLQASCHRLFWEPPRSCIRPKDDQLISMVFSFETHHAVFILVQTSDHVISCRSRWPLAALNKFWMQFENAWLKIPELILMKEVRKIKYAYVV